MHECMNGCMHEVQARVIKATIAHSTQKPSPQPQQESIIAYLMIGMPMIPLSLKGAGGSNRKGWGPFKEGEGDPCKHRGAASKTREIESTSLSTSGSPAQAVVSVSTKSENTCNRPLSLSSLAVPSLSLSLSASLVSSAMKFQHL